MILKTRNTLDQTAPVSSLSNTEAAGTTVFRIKNTAGFGSAWAVQIGETGHEQSEVLILSGTASGTVGTTTVAALYEHPADTPIYAIKYNQVLFERSTTGTAGTATPIGTVTYQADSPYTIFDDTSGASSYAYRARFQGPTVGSTSQSDWITPSGFAYYSLAEMRQRVRDKLWDSVFIKDDDLVNRWINEWREELANSAIEANQDYQYGTVDVAFGTNGLGTITTGNFAQVRRLDITYNSIDWVQSTKSQSNEFEKAQGFSTTHPYHNYVGDTVLEIHPAEQGGTARVSYYQFGTVLVNDTDELPQTMKRFTKGFVDYAKLQAQYKDGKTSQEQIDTFSIIEKGKFVKSLSPRDQSSTTQIGLVELISADQYV